MPKPRVPGRDRIEIVADQSWVQRVTTQAERYHVGLSSYIKMAVTERLERDEATDPQQKAEGDVSE
jgi:hypothetical protein